MSLLAPRVIAIFSRENSLNPHPAGALEGQDVCQPQAFAAHSPRTNMPESEHMFLQSNMRFKREAVPSFRMGPPALQK
ncbi:hypothetical protein CU048_02235 [Beijerinckiaceae bacterium]|nr:hypothetical protein CU048_02235 [Beijerinckiaceae bacterium]